MQIFSYLIKQKKKKKEKELKGDRGLLNTEEMVVG